MVLTVEYRIPLPMTVEEYRVAQMYMIDKKSREESHGTGEERSGVEIVINEPYTDGPGGSGQYTKKIFHIGTHLPGWFRAILPKSALIVVEEAWNAYPYTRTKFTTPFVEKFYIDVETHYCNDNGCQENIFKLSAAELAERTVDLVDIANDAVDRKDYKATEDPKLFVSEKTKRGPLGADWINSSTPIMTAYKLARADFRYWGMQSKIERFIHGTALRKTLLSGHRSAWCWQDEWVGLTMADIRRMERETMHRLRKIMGSDAGESAVKYAPGAVSNSLMAMEQAQAAMAPSRKAADLVLATSDTDDDLDGDGGDADAFFDAGDEDELPFEDAVSELGPPLSPQLHSLHLPPRHSFSRSVTACSTTSSSCGAGPLKWQPFDAHLFIVITGSTNFALGCHGLEGDMFLAFRDVMAEVSLDGRAHFFEHILLPDVTTELTLRARTVAASLHSAVCVAVASEAYRALVVTARTVLDARVAAFKMQFPLHVGKIHVVADCLGGLLLFDILTHTPLSFTITDVFTLGSPVALLALERFQGKLTGVSLNCGHFFNIFGDSDAFGLRLEPLLLPAFQNIEPIALPDFRQFPLGNSEAYLVQDALCATVGGLAGVVWWGDRRVDYCVDVPAAIRAAANATPIVQASYWELLDVAAFILRETSGRRLATAVFEVPVLPFTLADRCEPWLSARAARKTRLLPSTHYGCDKIILAGDHKTLVLEAYMVYGRSFYPVGERVSVLMASPPSGTWVIVAHGVVVDKHGAVRVPVASQQLAPGVHHVRVVMQADHSFGSSFVHVLPRPRSLVVVFNINAVFASNHSFSAANAQLRPHATELAKFWKESGYVLVYLTGRPLWQRPDVEEWMIERGFPHGVFFFADTVMLPQAQQVYKSAVLAQLLRLHANIAAAYGSDRDVANFVAVGVPKSRLFAVGKKPVEHATSICDIFTHLAALRTEFNAAATSSGSAGTSGDAITDALPSAPRAPSASPPPPRREVLGGKASQQMSDV